MDNGVIDISGKLDEFRLKNELIGLYMSEAELEEFWEWGAEIDEYFIDTAEGTLILWDGHTFLNLGDGIWMIDGDEWEAPMGNGVANWFEEMWR